MEYQVKIPSGWNEVSLRMFNDLNEAMKKAGGNPYQISLESISILCDIPLDEVKSWPVNSFKTSGLQEALKFVLEKPKKAIPSEKIKLNGKEYNVCLYPQKWTAGQYLDYTTVMSMENVSDQMARILACFIVPKGCEYGKGYDFEDLVNEINDNMDIETALGISDFFLLEFSSFVKALTRYSEKKIRRLKKSTLKPESL